MLPLAGWAIVQVHGMTLIGKVCAPSGMGAQSQRLSPVYELKPQIASDHQGVHVGHLAVPVWLLGLTEVEIPVGALVEPLEAFAPRIRESLQKVVNAAEEMAVMLRAEASGITVAGADTRLPPHMGGFGR